MCCLEFSALRVGEKLQVDFVLLFMSLSFVSLSIILWRLREYYQFATNLQKTFNLQS